MNARTFMQRLQADGISLRMEDGRLQYDAPKGRITDALLSELRRHKSSIIAELSREGACVPKVEPPPYIARCPRCHGTRWGPTAPAMPETLPNGEQVMTEVWGCMTCSSA